MNLSSINKVFFAFIILLSAWSCSHQEEVLADIENEYENIPLSIIEQLQAAGFRTHAGLSKNDDGTYTVEYDINLTTHQIKDLAAQASNSDHPNEEHYYAGNLVSSFRVIKVYIEPAFNGRQEAYIYTALQRFNTLDLNITFELTTSSTDYDIRVTPLLNSSGYGLTDFPIGNNPGEVLRLNLGMFRRQDRLSVIAHEFGHAIGFRHSDYMDTNFSCEGRGRNEGTTPNDAIHVSGTTVTPLANSWMLACAGDNDRPFTEDDIAGLYSLYGMKIGGNNVNCGTSFNFTLDDLIPSGATVTWSASPQSYFTQSTGTGSTANLSTSNSQAAGNAQIEFTVTTAEGDVFKGSRTFQVGFPIVTTIPTGHPTVQAQVGSIITIKGFPNSPSSLNWWSSSSTGARILSTSGNNAVVECASAGTYSVFVNGTNSCGTGPTWRVLINVGGSSGGGGGGSDGDHPM